MNAIEHVKQLAQQIGPRGSATAQEKAAADYAANSLEMMGLSPTVETFRTARSAWLPAGLFWSLMLAAGFLFVGGTQVGKMLSLPIAVLALGSIVLELTFRTNPLRWLLPKGPSQNVWVRIPSSGPLRERAALVAHLDTHRTPLVFSSDRWVRWFGRVVPIGFTFALVQIAIIIAGFVRPEIWIRYLVIAPMLPSFGLLALMLQADFTPYSPGANDNASGVGVALSMAERLAARPLEHTEVWIVLTGSEEVGSYGANAFLRRHRADLPGAAWLTVDTVGSRDGAPVFLSQETFLCPVRSDPELLRIARQVAVNHPQWRAREIKTKGAYTDGALGAKHGLRVLTFGSHTPGGGLSNWHRPTDTVDRMGEECLLTSEAFVLGVLTQMDTGSVQQEAH